jgi:calcium/calmodulin-dependent protein kinase I
MGQSSTKSASFENSYTLGAELGKGKFSVVREGIHKVTGEKYAIKCIAKSKLSLTEKSAVKTEIELLEEIR